MFPVSDLCPVILWQRIFHKVAKKLSLHVLSELLKNDPSFCDCENPCIFPWFLHYNHSQRTLQMPEHDMEDPSGLLHISYLQTTYKPYPLQDLPEHRLQEPLITAQHCGFRPHISFRISVRIRITAPSSVIHG